MICVVGQGVLRFYRLNEGTLKTFGYAKVIK